MKLPFLHENNVVAVRDLEVDDWFRLGGETYRITDLDTNTFGERVIHFIPWDRRFGGVPSRGNMLILPMDAFFKAYSQAPSQRPRVQYNGPHFTPNIRFEPPNRYSSMLPGWFGR